jgi:hypothetical protein
MKFKKTYLIKFTISQQIHNLKKSLKKSQKGLKYKILSLYSKKRYLSL